jgi:hypothetical protein
MGLLYLYLYIKDLDTVTDIKNKRLKWVGYVVRMDQGRVVNTLGTEHLNC